MPSRRSRRRLILACLGASLATNGVRPAWAQAGGSYPVQRDTGEWVRLIKEQSITGDE